MIAALLLSGTLTVEWIIHSEDDFRIEWTYAVTTNLQKDLVSFTRKPTENKIDGETIPLPAELDAWQWNVVFRPGHAPDHGKQFLDSADRRLQRLIDFVQPEKGYQPGLSWSVEFPEIPVDLAPKSVAKWTLGQYDKTASYLPFTMTFAEDRRSNQMTAEGKGLIDARTGYISELTLTAKNAPVPGGQNGGTTYKVSLKLAPSKAKQTLQ